MKKSVLVLASVCVLFLFAACTLRAGSPAASTAGTAASAANDTAEASSTADATASSTAAASVSAPASASAAASPGASSPSSTAAAPASADQSPAATTEKPADSGLTLEGLKKAALSAGYEVGTVEVYQIPENPKPAGSFNLIYKDDNTQAQIPVFVFKTAQDAQSYAKEVNESGYNLCIVNGKFLTMTGSKYGVTLNDNQRTVLETLLKSKVMAYAEPSAVPLPSAKDYAGACKQVDIIYTALDTLVNKTVLLYDKKAAPEQNIENAFVSFSLISSGDLSFTATLGESQSQLDAVKQLWAMFGVKDMKVLKNAANDYTLTGQRAGLDTSFELHCSFDPGTGSLRLKDSDGGKVIEFFEFVPLSGDRYAFQTLYERAIVTYKDGKITSFIYALNERTEEKAYNPDKDSIYGKPAAAAEAWVAPAGKDTYDQFITYDGTTLAIAANSMLGDRLNVDIKVG